MTSYWAVTPWVGSVVIPAVIGWPYQVEAREPGARLGSTSMQGQLKMEVHMVSPDLMIPSMNATNGRNGQDERGRKQ